MKTARIIVHPRFQIGEISPRLYGAFLEPIGTMVNGSMYNPKHPTADANGFRKDFIDALKSTGIPAVRLPGGQFRFRLGLEGLHRPDRKTENAAGYRLVPVLYQ